EWSMGDLLPYFRSRLRSSGFASASLMPIVHAFEYAKPNGNYYVRPRAADLAAQISAYCDAGAISVLFFTWGNMKDAADRSYVDDPQIKAGVQKGMAYCRSRWGH